MACTTYHHDPTICLVARIKKLNLFTVGSDSDPSVGLDCETRRFEAVRIASFEFVNLAPSQNPLQYENHGKISLRENKHIGYMSMFLVALSHRILSVSRDGRAC